MGGHYSQTTIIPYENQFFIHDSKLGPVGNIDQEIVIDGQRQIQNSLILENEILYSPLLEVNFKTTTGCGIDEYKDTQIHYLKRIS